MKWFRRAEPEVHLVEAFQGPMENPVEPADQVADDGEFWPVPARDPGEALRERVVDLVVVNRPSADTTKVLAMAAALVSFITNGKSDA